jgi:SAM-dependent methyltransferase
MPVIPFYGARHPELFAIERSAMDRPGRVADVLNGVLPRSGRLLDIGAGDGFMALQLAAPGRTILPLEPDPGMVRRERALQWVAGEAEALPFHAASFDGAYATWAYFFPSRHSIESAVDEAERVLKPEGVLAVVNNLGGDEFCQLSASDLSEPSGPFLELGFSLTVIDTFFEFESMEQAERLLSFYFGSSGRSGAKIKLSYRVGLYCKRVAASSL